MTTWQQLAREHPDLMGPAEARLRATKHHVLATLRRDGAPRVSGTEVQFHGDDLVLGMMVGSRKAQDLRRDGRYALHANPGEGTMEGGDAKVAGRAEEVLDEAVLASYLGDLLAASVGDTPPPGEFHLFRLDVREVVLTTVHPDGDRLVIDGWYEDVGRRTVDRF